jgi:hypothetical protein
MGARMGLGPVYELCCGMAGRQAGPGRIEVSWQCEVWPLLGLASVESVELPEGCLMLDVGELNPFERQAMSLAVAKCREHLQRMLVAQRTGLSLG